MSDQNMKFVAGEKQLVWHEGHITREDRARFFRQQPATLWFTGLSGAGKSTVAFALERRLLEMGQASYVLDGDNVRHGLSRDLGFSPEDRTENIRRIAEVAKLMNEAGLMVITAFISPYRADREVARNAVGAENFLEVYVNTPLAVCEQRDPKGFYKRARAGELKEYTGISAPYEAPLDPAITLDTAEADVETCVGSILELLKGRLG